MVKNCGDYVHFQIAERNILGEMVKIVKKKADMIVRDKILALLDSWQEAFGGPGGKHPQYYWAYEELRRSGVEFPKRSTNAAPIFTPPATHPTLNQPGYGMPSNSSRRLDETMATEIESLSLSSLDSMRDVMELLSDMMQAINPNDRAAVKDEVIVDLVNRCRSNQKKLMQMITTTGDEELLAQGLELNDGLQSILAKHDAIASGSPIPIQVANVSPKPTEASTSSKPSPNEAKNSSPAPNISPPAPIATVTRSQIDEEEEEEDDFAQLARRHSRAQSTASQSTSAGTSGAIVPIDNATVTPSNVPTASTSTTCNALALPDPPATVRTTKEQDLIDLLSLTLPTSASSPQIPPRPSASHQNMHQAHVPPSTRGYPYTPQTYPGSQGQLPYNNYVVPWAQPQQPPQPQPQKPSLPQVPAQYHSQQKVHLQSQPQIDPQSQFQPQPQQNNYVAPWAQPQQQQQQPHPQPQPQPQKPSLPQVPAQYHSQQKVHLQSQPQIDPQSHIQSQFQAESQAQNQSNSLSQGQPQFQTQSQPQFRPQSQFQLRPQSQSQLQHQAQQQTQPQLQAQSQTQTQSFSQPQYQPHFQSQYPQYSSGYPPPPWATTPGYLNSQNYHSSANNTFSTPQLNATTSNSMIVSRPLQHVNSFPMKGSNGAPLNGDSWGSMGARNPAPSSGQKPFIPSYRLFEDLNVLGNADGRLKTTTTGASPSLSGTSTQSMVGRKEVRR
ncbi:hypothetical protein DITRI_Ditri15bG0008900 [Diplodiscus trichospermus]